MSDFGRSNAIEQSNNLISSGLSNAREARVYNQAQKTSFNTSINTIKGKDATGKAEAGGKEGATTAGAIVSSGKQISAVKSLGLKGYAKSQPAQISENLSAFKEGTKSAFGMGTKAETASKGAPLFSSGPGPGRSLDVVKGGAEDLGGAVGKGGVDEGTGLIEGIAKKALGGFTDLPTKQIGALAKGAGAFASIGGGVLTGIEDIASGSTGGTEGKSATGMYKASGDMSMIAGGLDAMSMAMPFMAPVAGIADVASGIMSIAGEASEAKAKKDKATADYNAGKESAPANVISQTAKGDVASQSTAQRTY